MKSDIRTQSAVNSRWKNVKEDRHLGENRVETFIPLVPSCPATNPLQIPTHCLHSTLPKLVVFFTVRIWSPYSQFYSNTDFSGRYLHTVAKKLDCLPLAEALLTKGGNGTCGKPDYRGNNRKHTRPDFQGIQLSLRNQNNGPDCQKNSALWAQRNRFVEVFRCLKTQIST